MIPQLAAAASAVTGVEVPEESLHVDLVPAYLRLTCRLVDEAGRVIDQSRDVADLIERYGARARAAWKSTSAPPRWEKTGATRWDFGDLPEFVTRRVANVEVRSYPALVDRGGSVDLTLLESAAAAARATLAGVRRLLFIEARGMISMVMARIPPPFARFDDAISSRAEGDAFRATVLARIIDDAFGLEVDDLPRTRERYTAMLHAGTPRIDRSSKLFTEAIKAAALELDRTLAALKTAARGRSGAAAMADIRAQLAQLFPPDVMAHVPLARLLHYPRYLRAAQVRLTRAVTDPQKDAGKLEPFAPLWTAFLARRDAARDQESADDLRWMFEELRVSIFAPELTTPISVSLQKAGAALNALR